MSDVQPVNGSNRRPRRRSHRPRNFIDGRTREGKAAKQWDARWQEIFKKIFGEAMTVNHGVALSEWQKQETRRAATLVIECEKLEEAARVGRDIDPQIYALLSEQQGRAFSRLGLK
jgi:hypothetical protein